MEMGGGESERRKCSKIFERAKRTCYISLVEEKVVGVGTAKC